MFSKGKKYKDGRRNYCKQCHSNYTTQYVKDNPEKRSKDNPDRKFKRHKLDKIQYVALLNKYDGKCHVCKIKDATNIDHDHNCCPGSYSCGYCVRGILCNQCNTALGLFKDNTQIIKNSLEYLS